MATPTSPQNTILVLTPPFVQGATIPVIGAHIGVPLAIYNLVPDGLGARVRIDPPQAGTVDPTDTIVLRLKGDLAPLDSKPVGNPNAPIEMRIAVGRLNHARVNELYYDIIRNSQNVGSSTPMLEALFNMIRPGLKDTRPDIDGHSELVMTLSDEIKNGVGPGFVSGQLCFTYPYCRAYDTITLKCNGEIVTFEVGANEAPKPPDPGSAAPTTVCFTVDRAFLDKAIRPSGTLDFSYTVTDQVLNPPDPDAVWSASQTVDENLDGKRFPGVIYRERPNDPGDVSGIIDLELLGTNRLQVIVLTNDPRLLAGDVIDGTYTANAEGKPDVVVPLRGVVEADEFGQKKVVILWVDNDKVIAGSTVKSVYTVLRNGTSIGQSVAATARVVGEGLPELLPPRLQKSLGGDFYPLDPSNQKGANVQVEVLGFRPGDEVKPIVDGASGAGSPVFDFKPLNTASRANFALDSAFIAANMGKPLKLSYVLRRSGKVYDSQVLDASVKRIADYDPALPVPTIDGVVASDLDVTQLAPTSKCLVAAWPHQVPGQIGWLRYEGIDSSGQPDTYHDLTGEPLGGVAGLTRDAPLAWLKALKHGSSLNVFLEVNYDGVRDAAKTVKCPPRSYTVKSVELKPTIDEVHEHTANKASVAHGASTHAVHLVIEGKANARKSVELRDNNLTIDTFVVEENGRFQRITTEQAVGDHNYRIIEQDTGAASEIRSLTIVAWKDSITDFEDETLGSWVKGPAGRTGYANSYKSFVNDTPTPSGHAGVVFSQSFQLLGGVAYSFSYRIRNFSPDSLNLKPSFSVSISSGQTILPIFDVPRDGEWYTQSNVFTVAMNGTYKIDMISHQDRGGGSWGFGGNDYMIDDIILKWVR